MRLLAWAAGDATLACVTFIIGPTGSSSRGPGRKSVAFGLVPEAPDPVLVTMLWDHVEDDLLAHLVRYVVMARGEPGCRNIDLCASLTVPGRVVIITKWASAAAQRVHFDGPAAVALAVAARDLGAPRPEVDLLEGISAHDLT
jgi:quinol monooxygenase YgiN